MLGIGIDCHSIVKGSLVDIIVLPVLVFNNFLFDSTCDIGSIDRYWMVYLSVIRGREYFLYIIMLTDWSGLLLRRSDVVYVIGD